MPIIAFILLFSILDFILLTVNFLLGLLIFYNLPIWTLLSQGTLDSDSAKSYNNKLREWQNRYKELIDENSDVLRKNPARLRIYDGTEIRKSNAVKINMQFFAESDIKNQASSSLKRAIRKYEKRIDEHIDKINNPQKYAPEWDNFSEQHKKGLIKHWNKEISNFKESIENRKNELNLRGEKYE